MMSKLKLIGALVASCAVVATAQEQLPNLTNQTPAARFTVTGLVWAPNPGDASICLWGDDKLAAMSFTVDDNCYGNVAWWRQTAEQYGFKVTWFLITDRITKASNSGFDGTWAQWREVAAAGHDLQSHTAWHLHTELPEWTGIDDEYRIAQEQINANIPGYKCDFLAFPGGANSYLNNRTNAATYYAANRGGSGFNAPNKIDYFAVKCQGWPQGDPTTNAAFANPDSLFNAANLNYYRAWAIYLNHLVNDYSAMTPMLNYIDSNQTNLWLCTFSEGAKYGQERDTATLTVTSNTADRIVMMLTDQMLDSRFNYPLTIKVRVNNNWPGVSAVQAGIPVEAKIVEYAGNKYALIKAVPDRGEISLASGTTTEFTATPTSGWTPLTVSFTDSSTIVGITNRFWDFGDGFTTNTAAAGVTHTYVSAGTNTVQLIVSGATETGTNTQAGLIRVTLPIAPSAGFSVFPASGTVPLAVDFTDTSTGSITNRFWDFGDGATTNTTATSVSHTYTATGTNTVNLIVSGPVGASTNTAVVTVTLPVAPIAGFSASPLAGIAPMVVTFTDTSTGSITNRFWNFGDGSITSTVATSVAHTYTFAGDKTVQLIVSGPSGVSTNTQSNVISVVSGSTGSLIVYDSFSSATGMPMVAGWAPAGWNTDSTTANDAGGYIKGGSLTNSGLPASEGNSFGLGARTADYWLNFTPTTLAVGETIYFSYIEKYNVIPAAGVTGAGGYVRLGNSTQAVSVATGIVTSRGSAGIPATSNAGFGLGTTSKTFTNAPSIGTSGTYDMVATYFIVASYTRGAGATDGSFKMWVNPDSATFGTATPPTATLSMASTVNAAKFDKLLIASGGSGSFPSDWQLDEVRIGTAWASVAPGVISAPVEDSNGDGIPDSWSTLHFGGPTNANPHALAANGMNTILEAYVSGLNPTNPASRFEVSKDRNTLGWNATSGRVYSVYWTTNLLNGFQPLETNILWPQSSWTDTVHGVQGDGFYKIKVQLGQ
jgi:PKD repeat protein